MTARDDKRGVRVAEMIAKMNDCVLDTDASGRPDGALVDTWTALVGALSTPLVAFCWYHDHQGWRIAENCPGPDWKPLYSAPVCTPSHVVPSKPIGAREGVLCYSPGDMCAGCDHYEGKAAVCSFAPSTIAPNLREIAKRHARNAVAPVGSREHESMDMIIAQNIVRQEEIIYWAMREADRLRTSPSAIAPNPYVTFFEAFEAQRVLPWFKDGRNDAEREAAADKVDEAWEAVVKIRIADGGKQT